MQDKSRSMVLTAEYIAAILKALFSDTELPELPEGVSYKGVFALARNHSLAGAVWAVLEERGVDVGDPELALMWSAERERDFAKNLVQTREFRAVTSALTEAKIPFLPMKGFLIKALWKSPEYRTMSDMDIYVGQDGIGRAGEVLTSLGYSLDHDGIVHDSYIKPPFVNVELHRELEHGSTASFHEWMPKQDNPYWYVMSDEEMLVFNVSHMYKHHRGGGSGIRSYADLYLYLGAKSATLDGEYLKKRLIEEGVYDFYLQSVALAEFWFGDREIDDNIRSTEYFVVTGGTYGNVENRVEHALRSESRTRYFFRRAFPSLEVMRSMYKWLKPMPFLLPVAWLVRLVGALFNGRMRRELSAIDKARKENKE